MFTFFEPSALFYCLADLAAPKGRVIGREIPVLCAEIPLELNGIAFPVIFL
jgi:hypothetical protein